MIMPILYTTIERKNILEQEMFFLSPEESLIHCLNVLDFHAALKGEPDKDEYNKDDKISWIKLKFTHDK